MQPMAHILGMSFPMDPNQQVSDTALMAQHLIKKRVVKTMNKPQPRPPVAKINTTNTRHKITRHDEYAWMRDDNWQDVLRNPDKLRPDIHDHLKAENSYTDEVLKPAHHSATKSTMKCADELMKMTPHLLTQRRLGMVFEI